MNEQKVTRHEVGERVKGLVSRSQLYDVLAGKRVMDLAELEAVCNALGLDYLAVTRDAQARASHPPQGHQSA